MNRRVLDSKRHPVPTPHKFFVNDGIYLDVYNFSRIEQAIAASIKAIFILLSKSNLNRRRDPISGTKVEEIIIGPINIVLGLHVNIRAMTIEAAPNMVTETMRDLKTFVGHKK